MRWRGPPEPLPPSATYLEVAFLDLEFTLQLLRGHASYCLHGVIPASPEHAGRDVARDLHNPYSRGIGGLPCPACQVVLPGLTERGAILARVLRVEACLVGEPVEKQHLGGNRAGRQHGTFGAFGGSLPSASPGTARGFPSARVGTPATTWHLHACNHLAPTWPPVTVPSSCKASKARLSKAAPVNAFTSSCRGTK